MRLACILAALVASVASRPQEGRERRDSPQCSDFADQGYNCVHFERCDEETKEEVIDGADNIDIREEIQNYFWCCRPHYHTQSISSGT